MVVVLKVVVGCTAVPLSGSVNQPANSYPVYSGIGNSPIASPGIISLDAGVTVPSLASNVIVIFSIQ